MASNQTDSPDGDGAESKGGSKLDNLSRDDLVKFVKKQMMLLQKSKNQCDELSRELKETKEKLQKETHNKPEDKNSDDSDEMVGLVEAYNASQTALEESATRISGLTEQMNCLQQKNDTLTSLYKCLQNEFDAVTLRNKELEQKVLSTTEAEEKTVETSSNQTASESLLCPNCGELKSKAEELEHKLESFEGERDALKLDLSQCQEKLSKAVIIVDKLKKERLQLKEQISELQTSHSALLELQEAFNSIKEEKAAANEEKLQILEELERTRNELAESLREHQIVIKQKDELESQLKDFQKAFDDALLLCTDVQIEEDASVQKSPEYLLRIISILKSECSDALASSNELKKSLDDMRGKLEEAVQDKLVTDSEMEKLQAQLDEANRVSLETSINVQEIQKVQLLLSESNNELVRVRTELESEKKHSNELQERLSCLEERGDATSQVQFGENAINLNDDEKLTLHRQIDQLKEEIEIHLKNEGELTSVNEKLMNQVKELETRLSEDNSRSTTGQTHDDTVFNTDRSSVDSVMAIEQQQQILENRGDSVGDVLENFSERDAIQQELMYMREKLSEWETMMQMLHNEKDNLEKEMTKMNKRENRNVVLLDEILLTLQNALKGQDLFHDQSKMMEDDGIVYSKLCVLQGILDEMNFERDEMREKIQHLNEQVAELETQVSDTTILSTKSDSNKTFGVTSQTLSVDSEKLQVSATELENSTENENLIKCDKNDPLSVVHEQQDLNEVSETGVCDNQLLMTEHIKRKVITKIQLVVVPCPVQKETVNLMEESKVVKTENQLEKVEEETLSEDSQDKVESLTKGDDVVDKPVTDVSNTQGFGEEHEEYLKTIRKEIEDVEHCLREKQNELSILCERVNSSGKGSDAEVEIEKLNKEWNQMKKEFECQMLSKDGEIRKLKDELNKVLEDAENHEVMEMHSLELERTKAEIESTCREKDVEIQSLMELHQKFKDEADERVNNLESQMQNLIEELERNRQDFAGTVSERDAEKQRLEELVSKHLRDEEEATSQLQVKTEQIQNLMGELSKVKEDEDSRLKEEIQKNNELYSEIDRLHEESAANVKIHESEMEELKKETEKIQKEFSDKENDMAKVISTSKEELEKMTREAELFIEEREKLIQKLKEEAGDHLKDQLDEVLSLKTDLAKLQKDSETKILEKEQASRELEECLISSKDMEEKLRNRDAEIENMKFDLVKVKEETEGQIKDKDNEMDRLKIELCEEREKIRVQIQDKDTEIMKLKSEFQEITTVGESDIKLKESECRRLEEELLEVRSQIKEKNDEIENLTKELLLLKKEFQEVVDKKSTEDGTLQQEQIRVKELDGVVEDRNKEIERLSKVIRIGEQNEILVKDKDVMIQSLSNDLMKTQKESADFVSNKNKEIQTLQKEIHSVKEEMQQVLNTKETEIQDLKAKLEEFEIHAHYIKDLNLELEKLREDYEKMKTLADERGEEVEKLKKELVKNVMESSLDRSDLESLDGKVEVSQNQTSSPSSSGDMLSSLQQQLKDREERETKLKQLTLKAKKESAEFKAKLNTCQKDLEVAQAKLHEAQSRKESNQSVQFQSLQAEYDHMESLFETEKNARQQLEKSMKKAAEELTTVKVNFAELSEEKLKMSWEMQKLEKEKKELEVSQADKEQQIQAERIQREQLTRDKAEVEVKLLKVDCQLKETEEELKTELKQLQEQLKASKQQLDLAKTEIQQSNMIDLEIADYERTVKALNATVADRDTKMKSLQEEIDRQQEQKIAMQKLLDSSTSQYSQLDDHCNKLKQLLMKSKKDLSEAKKLEGEQRTTDAQLRGQLERLTQLTEEQKLQISTLLADNQKQSDKLRLHSDNHQRTAQSMELKVQSLEHDLEVTKSEMATVQAEYEGYKVRVHSVLKHQKTRSGANDEASLEQERFERQQLEKFVESLKTKLTEVSHQVASVTSEYELLQEEHERLQLRNTKLITEMENSDRNWRDRLEKLNSESSLNSMKKVEVIQQLTVQSEIIASNYKEQVQSIQEEHQRVVDSLKQQLESAEIELDRYHARFQNINQNPPANSGASFPVLDHDSAGDRVLEFVKELRPEERQSGEGSENIEDLTTKMTPGINTSLLPFEQLLDTPQVDDVMSVKTMESTAEELVLKSHVASAEKRIEHLSQLLNESEATVLRLTEQASILKGEIRRMERNQERETAISNLEYLKNIVYKFLTLKGGDERLQLIPVLTTMLKFSPDERDKMTAIASGTEGAAAAAASQEAAGWSTYLHRWSGLV